MRTTKTISSKRQQPKESLIWEAKVNSAIAELTMSLLSPASIEDISSLVLKHAQSLTDSEFGYVGYIDPETGYLIIPTLIKDIWGDCQVKDKNIIFKEFKGLWGWVLHNREPILTNDPSADPRSSGIPPGHVPIHRFLSVPALIKEELVGQVSLANSNRDYTERDLALIKRLASLFALAIHRNRTEKELSDSEEKYRTLVDNINIGIYRNTGGPHGCFLQANPAIVRMFGYDSVEEFLKIPTSELYQNQEDRKNFVEKIQKQGYVKDGQLKLRKKDDTPIWGSVTAKVQYDENGEIKWIDGVIEDITERKQAQDALFESEERLRSFFNSVTDFIYVLDKNGTIIQVNPAVINTLGYTEDELVGSHIAKFFTLASQEIFTEQFPILLNQKFIRQEINVVCKDGTIINTDCTGSTVCNDRGETINIVVLQKDITKRKRAEERLVQSLEALQSVYNIATKMRGSYEAVCDQVVFNLANLLRISYVAVQHIEEDQVKIISRITDEKFTHNEISYLEHSPCAMVCEKREPCQIKGSLQQIFPENKFLSYYNFKTHIGVPIKNINGKVVGSLCAMDYEDRTFSEDEIRLIEIFKRYVAYEYERNIMETQLRQLDRMKLLGQMAAGVAHEVRNPLNAILAITEALFQDIGDNPEYKPYLNHIRTQVDRLSRLMGDLLDLGKPIQPSNLHRESLPLICAAAMDLWKQTPLSQTHKARLVLPSELNNLNIMADSSRLQQVFLNLLENAAQHSPDGSEPQLVISKPKGKTARICVVDQGTGIAPENFKKVFEPFFTTRKRGNGLGLSIVKNTIQAHGGDVSIRNNDPPPGCTVEISLPII